MLRLSRTALHAPLLPARALVIASLSLSAALWLMPQTVSAQMEPKRAATPSTMMSHVMPMNVNADGVAIHGYDPVAYFTAGAPTKGTNAFTASWQGATFQFASAANRDAFVAKPDAYAPQYGGYCAMGMVGGGKYDIDPSAWRVENGRLYLNKDPRTQQSWLRDVPGHIVKADAKWPTVVAKEQKK